MDTSPSPAPLISEFEFEFESEFEFWNSSLQPLGTPLHSADQLFSHGFLLPLHPLPTPQTNTQPSALISSHAYASSCGNPILGASKRWRQIFNKKPTTNNNDDDDNNNNNNNKSEQVNKQAKVDDKKRDKNRKNRHAPGSAELNINIWPFSRSRSSGSGSTTTTRSTKPPLLNRKVSSAPCSRSNSSGESKSSRRSCPSSPGRPGLYVGRSSPVWQARRAGPGGRGEARMGKVLNLNVPVCVGGNWQSSCRSDGVKGGTAGGNGNLFGLRGLFRKRSNTRAVLTA